MTKITGSTALYFIIGDPVAQVRAPEVFNRVFDRGGIDAILAPARVAPAHLEAFVRAALSSPTVKGFFVAIPHKAPLLRFADHATRAAQVAGAANAVRRGVGGGIEAELLDGEGFVRALKHFSIAVKNKRILIVGAGGGACAIGAAIAGDGVESIDYFDTVPGKAETAAGLMQKHFNVRAGAVQTPDPTGYDLVVNASPAGLNPGDPLPVPVEQLERGSALIDIIMTPRPTRLVQLARERGIRAFPGYEMLVQQVPLYLRFFGYGELAGRMEQDLSEVRKALLP